jgi:hypothetical protein
MPTAIICTPTTYRLPAPSIRIGTHQWRYVRSELPQSLPRAVRPLLASVVFLACGTSTLNNQSRGGSAPSDMVAASTIVVPPSVT